MFIEARDKADDFVSEDIEPVLAYSEIMEYAHSNHKLVQKYPSRKRATWAKCWYQYNAGMHRDVKIFEEAWISSLGENTSRGSEKSRGSTHEQDRLLNCWNINGTLPTSL